MSRHPVRSLRSSLVSVVLVVPLLGLAAPCASAVLPRTDGPVAPMTLTAFTITPTSASVAGFGSVDVSFAATLNLQGSTVASCSEAGDDGRFANALWVGLTRIDRPPIVPLSDGMDYAMVPLTTSTPGSSATSGTWTGTWKVASTRGGRWRVTEVAGCLSGTLPYAGTMKHATSVDPAALGLPSVVTVAARRAPRITARVLPRKWPAAPILQVLVYLGGRPVVGRKVLFAADIGCLWDSGVLVPTNSLGIASWPMTDPFVHCWRVTTPPAAAAKIDVTTALMAAGNAGPPHWLFSTLSVTKPVTAVRGRSLIVSGAVTPTSARLAARYGQAGSQVALLQRLIGGRTWRTIAVASVRSSGRFALVTVPQSRGRMVLRVSVSGYLGEASSPWATFGPNRTAPWVLAVRSS